ncbi:hypothetical protein RFI_03203, partial [Reticulomyxa filosa]
MEKDLPRIFLIKKIYFKTSLTKRDKKETDIGVFISFIFSKQIYCNVQDPDFLFGLDCIRKKTNKLFFLTSLFLKKILLKYHCVTFIKFSFCFCFEGIYFFFFFLQSSYKLYVSFDTLSLTQTITNWQKIEDMKDSSALREDEEFEPSETRKRRLSESVRTIGSYYQSMENHVIEWREVSQGSGLEEKPMKKEKEKENKKKKKKKKKMEEMTKKEGIQMPNVLQSYSPQDLTPMKSNVETKRTWRSESEEIAYNGVHINKSQCKKPLLKKIDSQTNQNIKLSPMHSVKNWTTIHSYRNILLGIMYNTIARFESYSNENRCCCGCFYDNVLCMRYNICPHWLYSTCCLCCFWGSNERKMCAFAVLYHKLYLIVYFVILVTTATLFAYDLIIFENNHRHLPSNVQSEPFFVQLLDMFCVALMIFDIFLQ